ncbi:TolC family protein [Acidicapsa ligni]|uniref:TolC family protein n=1 Tax=Acidicapsa ligni TaxID=542300 RepID=UPI0021E08ADE|nr:TolC family protein [Acidicapsa ligni]
MIKPQASKPQPRTTRSANRREHSSASWAALAVLLCSSFGPAIAHAQISLATIVDQAQRNSSAVKLATADVRKAQALFAQSKDVYIPNLIIGSSIGPPSIGFPVNQPSIASATMQSLAFSYPQRQYIAAAMAGINGASLALKDAREQVALDASTNYIELDTVNRELQAAHDQAEFSDRLIKIEQERSEAGIDSVSDLLQARLTAAQLKLKLLHLQARAGSLVAELATLTGLPASTIVTDPASIPQIPDVKDDAIPTSAIEAAQAQAKSRQLQAHGDELATKIRPQIGFGAQYNRDATSLNNYNLYYGKAGQKLKADSFGAGFSIQIPIFDLMHRAKARESSAEALRATVEAEQAQRQNDVQIATLTGNLRELDAVAEVASLKQQIAGEQLKAVQSQLAYGNGAGTDPGAPPQLSPKAEQLARIDERQKQVDAIDAGFDLTKVRLNLLRALGHMDEWLKTLSTDPASASAAVSTGAETRGAVKPQ